MYMQSTGIGLVAHVAQPQSLLRYFSPWHFLFVIIEAHWVGDDFKPVTKGTIALDIYVFVLLIGYPEYLVRLLTGFSAVVNFKFYAEIAIALSEKDWVGLVAIIVNTSVGAVVKTVAAVCLIVIIVVGIIVVK